MPKNREGKFFSRTVNGRPETERERKERIMPGYEDIKKLSSGIMEEDENECERLYYLNDETKECCPANEPIEEENENHDSSGRFSDDKSATCRSTYFVNKKRVRVGGGLTDKHATGRGKKKTSQGKRRCHNDSLKEVIGFKNSNGIVSVVTVKDFYQLIEEVLAEVLEGPPRVGRGL